MGNFQLYRDRKQGYRWRLRARNGRIIVDSGEGYTRKDACEHGIALPLAWDGEIEVFQDKGGGHRWHMRAANNEIFADSGEGYSRRSGVTRALAAVRRTVRDAAIDDQSAEA